MELRGAGRSRQEPAGAEKSPAGACSGASCFYFFQWKRMENVTLVQKPAAREKQFEFLSLRGRSPGFSLGVNHITNMPTLGWKEGLQLSQHATIFIMLSACGAFTR